VLTAIPTGLVFPQIDNRRPPAELEIQPLDRLPAYDPTSRDPLQIDLRSRDLSALDLRQRLDDLLYAVYDTRTVWPPAGRMPPGFDPQTILEMGKNPGLGLRALHQRGIDGRGVGIAIIDQALLSEHPQYAARLQYYGEINLPAHWSAAMHASAVASLAVGQTCGVAPGADLYYIGSTTQDRSVSADDPGWNFTYYAEAIRRILQINQQLPEARRIRVIAIQTGWAPEQSGYEEINLAVQQARQEGIFVVSSSLDRTYDLHFDGLGRDPRRDPDDFTSYEPGYFWAPGFYANPSEQPGNALLVPMDGRSFAGYTGLQDFTFARPGGWSWAIPYIAGAYALAAQVESSITPERFWELALQTGRTIQIERDGQVYALGPILDMTALVGELGR
jgi:hypothetical protein